MGVVEAAYALGASLLVVGGVLKLLDPSGTVGALRALGLSVPVALVRVLAAAEAVLGAAAWTAGGSVVPTLVAGAMLLFIVVVVGALVRAVPIDSCGCFGGFETPPSRWHLLVLAVAGAGALGVAVDPGRAVVDAIDADAGSGALFVVVVLVALGGAVMVMRRGRRAIGTPR